MRNPAFTYCIQQPAINIQQIISVKKSSLMFTDGFPKEIMRDEARLKQ